MTVDVHAVAAQARTIPAVVDLHRGRDGTIATDTVTGPVVGVRVDRTTLVIGAVGRAGVNTVQLVDDIRSAVAGCPDELSISVSVEARSDV